MKVYIQELSILSRYDLVSLCLGSFDPRDDLFILADLDLQETVHKDLLVCTTYNVGPVGGDRLEGGVTVIEQPNTLFSISPFKFPTISSVLKDSLTQKCISL